MEQSSSPSPSPSSPSQPNDRTTQSHMDIHAPPLPDDSSANWDWGDLLDFTVVDDDLPIPWDSGQAHDPPPPPPEPPARSETQEPGRVRKRDPRMTCSNFLAGRVPCACPELDEKMMELEEEDAGHGNKKRAKTVRVSTGVVLCQVPACGADIRELKGYHRRHRVCLRCANATTVVLDGETKRYCQQCGKFHLLSDFDEGKRSCRRKLERHNNRRRRKPMDSKVTNGKESQGDTQSEYINCDGEAGEDSLQFSSQLVEKEAPPESEAGHVSTISPAPDSKDTNSDGFASGETQMDIQTHNLKHSLSPSYCENKSAYSSMCPTGRISFKLYDWNPAEFPRRLRHQIFQWLSNMPVELEGYIRPGCIILTVFVAMPRFMWMKVFENPIAYVHDIIVSPGRMLSGRGNVLVYLNNMIFHVKNGTSVINAKVKVETPRLHYVHPTCFEAGKPMEFVACGSNLLQPKLRFLISFSGKYLAYDYCYESTHFQSGGSTECSFDHQLYRIHVPYTEASNFGPAFIEVENEAGLSNFIPVIIGGKDICSEIKMIEQRLDSSHFSEGSNFSSMSSLSDSCEVSSLRQKSFSEVVLDIAWLLKRPGSESFQQIMTSSKIQRFNRLLNFLILVESTAILERILQNLKIIMINMKSSGGYNGNIDADLGLLGKYMNYANERIRQKTSTAGSTALHSETDVRSVVPFSSQDMEIIVNGKVEVMAGPSSNKTSETVPLLNREAVLEAKIVEEWLGKPPGKPSGPSSSRKVLSCRSTGPFLIFRPSLYIIATVAICLGVCAVLFHPSKVGEFALSIRRCLLGKF